MISRPRYTTGDVIQQTWHPVFIFLAFFVSFVASFSAIRLLDHDVWRTEKEKDVATKVIIKYPGALASIILGAGTVWSMHFIGMSAVTLNSVPICYNWAITLGSLVAAVTFMWFGVRIASRDIFNGPDRVKKLQKILITIPSVSTKRRMNEANKVIYIVAFFTRLHWILLGSAFAAAGALIMHYTGMIAQQGPFRPEWSIVFLSLSVFLGLVICAVGFWIIFRLLHWKVEKFWLRPVSAVIIAIAVCALHFFGMLSATYIYDETLEGKCDVMLSRQDASPNAWTTHQMVDLVVAIIVPTAAMIVEYLLCRELMMAYSYLKDPSFKADCFFRNSVSDSKTEFITPPSEHAKSPLFCEPRDSIQANKLLTHIPPASAIQLRTHLHDEENPPQNENGAFCRIRRCKSAGDIHEVYHHSVFG